MFDLIRPGKSVRVVSIGDLGSGGMSIALAIDAGLRIQERCGERLGRRELEGYVAAFDAIVSAGVFRIAEDDPGVFRFPQSVSRTRDREQFTLAVDCASTIPDVLRSFIRRIEQPERCFSQGAGQLGAPGWIDDMTRVHGCSHIAVAASASDIE